MLKTHKGNNQPLDCQEGSDGCQRGRKKQYSSCFLLFVLNMMETENSTQDLSKLINWVTHDEIGGRDRQREETLASIVLIRKSPLLNIT